jgi:hypothetical protein
LEDVHFTVAYLSGKSFAEVTRGDSTDVAVGGLSRNIQIPPVLSEFRQS